MDPERRHILPVALLLALLATAVPHLADAAEDDEAEETAWTSRREASGLGFDLSVGGLGTIRSFRFSGERETIEHHPTPYLGGMGRGRLTLATFGERHANLLVEVEGGYGSARNRAPEPGTSILLVTEHTYLHALALLERPLTPSLDLNLGLGAGATSFTIKPNPRYTGHRYINLIAQFGVTRWFAAPFRISGGMTLYPGISTNQSDGGYGAVRSFGGRLDLTGGWRFFQPTPGDASGSADLDLRYSYTRFQSTYPETQALGDLATSHDQSHTITLMVTYAL